MTAETSRRRQPPEISFADTIFLTCHALYARFVRVQVDGPARPDHLELKTAQMMLAKRMLMVFEAIRLLLRHRYAKEAAILVRALLETASDVIYIGDQDQHARSWRNHQTRTREPWRPREKLPVIAKYSQLYDYGAAYQELSMIAHANVLSGTNLYSIRSLRSTRRPTKWKDFAATHASIHRAMAALGEAYDLRGEWKRHQRLVRLLRKADRTTRERERKFAAWVAFLCGVLLKDAFGTITSVWSQWFPAEREWLSAQLEAMREAEWELAQMPAV